MSKIPVCVKYFWDGSAFYSGTMPHCIVLPLSPVPEDMKAHLKKDIVPHFQFSCVQFPVKQTINSLPGYVVQPGDEWHLAYLEQTENGYLFHSIYENKSYKMMTPVTGPDAGKIFVISESE